MEYSLLIERIQTTFIKKMMFLPPQTAGYAIRLEFSRGQIQSNIFRRSIKFWSKVIQLDNKRLSKLCLLDALQHQTKNNYPWLQDFENRLKTIGQSINVAYTEALNNQLNGDYWSKLYNEQLKRDDVIKLGNTHTYGGLKLMYCENDSNNYLYRQTNIKLKRILLRLRFETSTIYINENKMTIDQVDSCKWCNTEENEDWAHVLFRCEYLNQIRPKDYKGRLTTSAQLVQLVSSLTLIQANEMYVFLKQVIAQRNQWKL